MRHFLPLLFFLAPASQANAQTNTIVNFRDTATTTTQVSPVQPLPIGGGFIQTARTADLSVTNTTGNIAFGVTAPTARVCNTSSTVTAYVALGGSTITTTASTGIPVQPSTCVNLSAVGYSYLAAITSSSTTTLQISLGSGFASLGGGSSGGSGSSSLTVGTTPIASGTTTRILYDNAGVLGEYTLSGSGTVVAMATSPSFTTPTLGVATATSVAIGGASIGTDALAWTGTATGSGRFTTGGITNTANGAASSSPSIWTGTVLTGGTGTTNFPAMFVQPTGTTAVTSWSISGTVFGVNAPSAFVGNFLDFHVFGAASIFSVSSAGMVTAPGGITANGNSSFGNGGFFIGSGSTTQIWNGGAYAFSSTSIASGTPDTFITRKAAASIQFGLADANPPVAQTSRVQSATGSNINGANWAHIGSLSTGSGTSGDMIFQTGVAPGGGSPTVQATATTALTIKGETQALVTAALDASSSTGGALQVAGGASIAKRFWIPAITASAGLQTAVLCQSSGGEMIADSVACLASSARFKDIRGALPDGAADKFMKLPIKIWAYKPEGIFKEGEWTRDRIGPIAEDVAELDPRLVEYDKEGRVRAYSTEQLLAYTIKVVQEQQAQIIGLKGRLR